MRIAPLVDVLQMNPRFFIPFVAAAVPNGLRIALIST